MDPIAARDLIRTITASYINRAEAVDTYVVEDILDDLIFDYEELYDPNNEIYKDHNKIQTLINDETIKYTNLILTIKLIIQFTKI